VRRGLIHLKRLIWAPSYTNKLASSGGGEG